MSTMRRYEKIMRAIDDGKTDEELAEMFPDKYTFHTEWVRRGKKQKT